MRHSQLVGSLLLLVFPWPVVREGVTDALKCTGPTGGCRCQFDDGSGSVDVSSLIQHDDKPVFEDVMGDDSKNYSFSPCGSFSEGNCSGASVCQVSLAAGGGGQVYVQVGDADTATWSYSDQEGSVSVVYSHTDPGPPTVFRQSFVTYKCNQSLDTAQFTASGGDTDAYFFTVSTKCACPNVCVTSGAPSPKLSGGSIFLIVCVALIAVYLLGGMVYNKTQRGASGVELIPNISFWRALGRSAKDGINFITCRYRKREQYSEVY